MKNSNDYPDNILLCTLYERTSAKGTVYLTGRLGAAKVAILPGKEVTADGTKTWRVLLSEAPPKQDGRPSDYARSSSQAPERSVSHSTAAGHLRRDAGPVIDDEIPF